MLYLENIQKTFHAGTPNQRVALRDVNLHMAPGDFATIIGSNGAGKSTLFNIISGHIIQDAGRVNLDGKNVSYAPEHKRSRSIGRLFQDPLRGTAPHMSIEENLALAYLRAGGGRGGLARISAADRALFAERLAGLGIGLETRMRQPVGLLSGGQRQALTLLMATLVPPKLLLLDEHTASLDPATAEQVLALTKEVVAQHSITCLMITHSLSGALALGNRTLMMDEGGIVLDVSGEERAAMSAGDLLEAFRQNAARALDADRVLLEKG